MSDFGNFLKYYLTCDMTIPGFCKCEKQGFGTTRQACRLISAFIFCCPSCSHQFFQPNVFLAATVEQTGLCFTLSEVMKAHFSAQGIFVN